MDADPVRVAARGQLTMSDAAWEQAQSRAAVIGSLAARGATGIAAADRAAAELGVSRRQVYVLLGRYRQGSGLVTDLAVRRSTGGKGGNRLPEPVEEIIRDLVRKRFLTRQKRSMAALHREIARACAARGFKAPTRNTVARRISMLNPVDVGRRREGADAAAAANNRRGGRPRKVDGPTAARARELKAKGISASDIGKMLGVSRATVYRYLVIMSTQSEPTGTARTVST